MLSVLFGKNNFPSTFHFFYHTLENIIGDSTKFYINFQHDQFLRDVEHSGQSRPPPTPKAFNFRFKLRVIPELSQILSSRPIRRLIHFDGGSLVPRTFRSTEVSGSPVN